MNEEQAMTCTELPRAKSCQLIDFDRVAVLTLETDPTQYFLVALGEKSYLDMEVDLVLLQ